MEFQGLLPFARSLVQSLHNDEQLPLFCLPQELIDATDSSMDLGLLLYSIEQHSQHCEVLVNIFQNYHKLCIDFL